SAALLKVNTTTADSLRYPLFQSGLVVWELLIGGALIFSFHAPVAWFFGAVTFFIFAIASFALGINGVAECGCFGGVKTSPWLSFAIDLLALGLLASGAGNAKKLINYLNGNALVLGAVFLICFSLTLAGAAIAGYNVPPGYTIGGERELVF